MSNFALFFRASLFTTLIVASMFSAAKDLGRGEMAELGPFLLISPAKILTLEYGLVPHFERYCERTNIL
jgi:hypothetical protein